MTNILVLCTGNSCRSQMAQGFLHKEVRASEINAQVYSAGIEAHGVNPLAIEVMAEAGVDISDHISQTVDDLPQISFDYVITVCDNAKESCPVFPQQTTKIHQSFEDPASFKGDEEEVMQGFRKVRDQIAAFSAEFVLEIGVANNN